MSEELPIIAKLREQVGTGYYYSGGYACIGGGRVESRPATEMKRPANRDGSEAAAVIEALYRALDKCRAIIKLHVKPEKCVSSGDDVISARDAFESAVAALNLATPNNDLPTGNDGKIGEGR